MTQSSLSEKEYSLAVKTNYSTAATMELYLDTGSDFNEHQKVEVNVSKGDNDLIFHFTLEHGDQLKKLRLDFGSNQDLDKVGIHDVTLYTNDNTILQLGSQKFEKNIDFMSGIRSVEDSTYTLMIDKSTKPYDSYVVLKPLNELIIPKWQRIVLLILPWVVLLFFPLLKWISHVKREEAYGLFFIGLFMAVIPLKIAWVTFTTLLLLGYAVYYFYKKRRIQLTKAHIALLLFFAVPLLFLGAGDASKLAIPLGFVLFAVIGATAGFEPYLSELKKIYITVFLVFMSIVVTSWVLLMLYDGFYYGITFFEYFANIKIHARSSLFWCYYDHATFLSFFCIVGGLFCLELYTERALSKTKGIVFAMLLFTSIIILGSRFALVLGCIIPFLYAIPVRHLQRWLLPVWAGIFGIVISFVGLLDAQRAQLWELALTAIREKPWLGHGTGTSSSILPEFLTVQQSGTDGIIQINHAHNQILTYLLENGVLGTLLFLGAFTFMVYATKPRNKTFSLISFMVLCLCIVESPFRTATPLYMISFLFALYAPIAQKE